MSENTHTAAEQIDHAAERTATMSTTICVNLFERFGKNYKVTFDPAYDSRHVPRRCLDPWMMQLPCRGKGVTVFPFGGDRLAVEVVGRPGLVKKLAAIPGLGVWQDGDREKTFLFNVALFEAVAAVVRPHRRRRLSEGQRAELAGRMRAANTSRREALLAR
jgi:hypothetical protein